MTDKPAIHFFNYEDPDEKLGQFPIYVYSGVIPRVGDGVHYWLDYPEHLGAAGHRCRDGEPIAITGCVVSVVLEYRMMRYAKDTLVEMVSVALADYVEIFAKESASIEKIDR